MHQPSVFAVIVRCLLVTPLLVFTACPSPKPKPTPPPTTGTLTLRNSSASAVDARVDNGPAGSLAGGSSRDQRVAAGVRMVEFRYQGTDLVAARGEITVPAGGTATATCNAPSCNEARIAGLRINNRSSKTSYDCFVDGSLVATVAAGQTSPVQRVTAGIRRIETRIAGTTVVLCSNANVVVDACGVSTWECRVEACEALGTGTVTFTNGYAIDAVLEVGGQSIRLRPGQSTPAIVLSVGRPTMALRDAGNMSRILCSGPIDVVRCELRSYRCGS